MSTSRDRETLTKCARRSAKLHRPSVGTETSYMLLVAAINSLVTVSTNKTPHVIITVLSPRNCVEIRR
ncbi:hypothetical protein NC651_028257 [Populus alba x Populus x berolinensis]|nr:hypothetical protein NC651_028257 [Populus alba x Populus x berolinensis]